MRYIRMIWLQLFVCLCISLNAQVDLRCITISGKVVEAKTGAGIGNVPVSDGFNIVQTDSQGHYQLITNRVADFVMLTVPSAYAIPLKGILPFFSRPIDKEKTEQQINFELVELRNPEINHQVIVYADPQVFNADDLRKFEVSADDMVETIRESAEPSYVMVCGDIVFDQPQLFDRYNEIITRLNRPVFHAKGNHDMTLGGWSMESSPDRFRKEFGPEYYSYNRGKVHYVVLDDVMYTARDYLYIGYLNERQMNWLKQDLSLVAPGSLVVVMFHIPAWSLENRLDPNARGSFLDCLQNRKHLFELLRPFNAHIFSGHNHCNENYVLGDRLFEHIHGGLCGSWWQADICTDGTPAGYAVYSVKGDDMTWYYKSTGKEKEYQIAVYPVGIDAERPKAFVANVWNWDPAWKVCWYENGRLMGEMNQHVGSDPFVARYFTENKGKWIHNWIHTAKTEHLFYAVPSSPDTEIRVEATDRFGYVYKSVLK